MRTLLYAVALAAGSAIASPVPDTPAENNIGGSASGSLGSDPVVQVTKASQPAMVQETVAPALWVTHARARKSLETFDNFIMNQPRVNVSLYAMSRCPDAVSATPPSSS